VEASVLLLWLVNVAMSSDFCDDYGEIGKNGTIIEAASWQAPLLR